MPLPEHDLDRRVTRLEEWRVYVDRILDSDERVTIPGAVWWALGVAVALGLFVLIGYLAGRGLP